MRLEQSRTEPGSGLGLALVDAIAELHRADFVLADGLGTDDAPGLDVQLVFPKVKPRRAMPRAKAKADA